MTKAIILAAGLGSRLKPLTHEKPKAMIRLLGLPMIDRSIKVIRNCSISDITIITGYMNEKFEALDIKTIHNQEYSKSNMVYSLFQAIELFDGSEDIIISYGDINYETSVLEKLLATKGDIVVTADKEWEVLWSKRMDDYFSDVETFKVDDNGFVINIGRKPENVEDVEAQYIGLIKINRNIQERLITLYNELGREKAKNMFMTDFIEYLVTKNIKIVPSFIRGGWIELDTLDDYNLYSESNHVFLKSKYNFIEPQPLTEIIKECLGEKNNKIEYMKSTDACQDFIHNIYKGDYMSNKVRETACFLGRKIEIAKIVFDKYGDDGKKLSNSSEISGIEYSALIACYILLYQKTKNLRYLNTALKGLDRTLIIKKMSSFFDLRYHCDEEVKNV